MIYVFCPRASTGAKELVARINALGTKAARVKSLNGIPQGHLVVNWGASLPPQFVEWYGRKNILNPKTYHNKYNELAALKKGDVHTVPFSLQKEKADWLARTVHHTEAKDLLKGLKVGDYYVGYVPTVREFRVHILHGVSIRAGIKAPRIANPNPRFRSWSAGWKLDYGAPCQAVITNRVRAAAKAAGEALHYDFGAVDVGVKEDGSAFVFEVNAAPGLEGNTIEVYAKKFKEEAHARNAG